MTDEIKTAIDAVSSQTWSVWFLIGAALVFNFKRLKREEFDGLKPKIDWGIVESFPFPAPFEEQRYIGDGGKIHVYSWDGRQKKTLVGPYSVRELYLEHFGES